MKTKTPTRSGGRKERIMTQIFAVKIVDANNINWGTYHGIAVNAAEAAKKGLGAAQKDPAAKEETLVVESVTRLGAKRF